MSTTNEHSLIEENPSTQENCAIETKQISAEQNAKKQFMVFLLDGSTSFAAPQKELLSLALRLQKQGLNPHIFCLPSSELMQKAKQYGLPIWPISNGIKPSFKGVWNVFWKQKKSVPLCIHTFTENCLPIANRIAKLRKENSTLMLHSCYDLPNKPKKLAKYWANPKKIIYPSKFAAGEWAKEGINPSQVHIIHTASQALISQEDKTTKRWIFIANESLEQSSGIDFLLKAMSALWQHPHLPDWEVRIIGSGPLFDQLLNEAQSLGVESRLAMLGDQKLDVLLKAHVMVCPFVEGQGNLSALMNAWNVGMPIICTMVNAHMEIANTNNALLVPEADPQRLAAAMIELMCRPERMQHFSRNSVVMQVYSQMSRLEDQYIKLYKECIARFGWAVQL